MTSVIRVAIQAFLIMAGLLFVLLILASGRALWN